MSIQLYVFVHNQVEAVNDWINDRGNLPQVWIHLTNEPAAYVWEHVCIRDLNNKPPYDGNNAPVYVPETDTTFYCDY